ncbi:glycosyltransferase [Bradyrhizobium sp. BRP56]|uniref:glycosyltransferase family protein n=1 Tax=Bradyrhizobium sp. BRP56 TaxID=2793819 RepID=UPI001CD53A16|nr:glycosyltransferase family 1 protein [Bradyrhizobium sp. BRP56]
MEGKVLLLSQRRISDLVAFCLSYEFEDNLAAMTRADRFDVRDRAALEFSRRVYKWTRLASGSTKLAGVLAPSPPQLRLQCDYELFFPIFSNAYQLHSLAAIPDWRKRCRKAACFITEVWADDIPEYLVELLSGFDHIFVGLHHCAPQIARIAGRPCSYLPLAVDVERFAPKPEQQRSIAVCNIGRRSATTHAALLAGAERERLFYYYDTVAASGSNRKERTFRVDNPEEHRIMIANILQRSRYFIANRSHVNNPEFTAGRDEISARFYEGAAAGAVMVGEAPRTEEFARQFDWPDAVIHVPFDSPDICQILEALDADPARLRAVQNANVREAALRHDWLYRIQAVFDILGIAHTDQMRARANRLRQIAGSFELPAAA